MKNPHKIGTIEHWEFENARTEAAFAVFDLRARGRKDRTNHRRDTASRHAWRQHSRRKASYKAADKAHWASEEAKP